MAKRKTTTAAHAATAPNATIEEVDRDDAAAAVLGYNTYVLSPIDALTQKSAQLHAMLEMTYGEARECFSNMNRELRDNYLWGCASLAHEIEKLANAVEGEFGSEARHD